MAWEKSIFIGCSHGDLVDPKAVKVVKNFIDEWKPKHRVHLGDLFDFRSLRRGASPEERAEKMLPDYQAGIQLLEWYRPQILTLGNHDYRIWRAAKETSNMALAEMLEGLCQRAEDDFRRLKIKWTPYGVGNYAQLPMGGVKLLHGYMSTISPAKSHYERYGDCILAHVHKPDYHEARHIDGGKAYTVGTLADISKMTYADSYTAKLGWRQSFLYGLHNTKTGKWHAWSAVNDGGEWISPHGIL